MLHIYDDAKDKNVANFLVFGDSTDNKLYYSEGSDKVQLSEADLNDTFLKGRLLICTNSTDDVFEVAVKVSGNKAYTLAMTGAEGSEVMSFVEWAALAAE